MDDNKQALNEEQLEQVAGGANNDYIHDLGNFLKKKVINVIHYDETACLTLRRTPGGTIIQGIGWQNGDTILVLKDYRESGWYFAYKNGKYGYVNPNNVQW